MNRNKILIYGWIFAFLIGIIFILCAWCPWVNESFAQQKAKEAFYKAWENSNDGCYLDCENCGLKETQKVIFGRTVKIDYQCGWEGDVITRESKEIFVSFSGNTNYNSFPYE